MRTPIKKGDPVTIKPEWQDSGDDQFTWMAMLLMVFELPRLLEEHSPEAMGPNGPVGGYLYYARMGILTLTAQQVSIVDEIMRRTWWKYHHGLHGQVSIEDLIARSVETKTGVQALAA